MAPLLSSARAAHPPDHSASLPSAPPAPTYATALPQPAGATPPGRSPCSRRPYFIFFCRRRLSSCLAPLLPPRRCLFTSSPLCTCWRCPCRRRRRRPTPVGAVLYLVAPPSSRAPPNPSAPLPPPGSADSLPSAPRVPRQRHHLPVHIAFPVGVATPTLGAAAFAHRPSATSLLRRRPSLVGVPLSSAPRSRRDRPPRVFAPPFCRRRRAFYVGGFLLSPRRRLFSVAPAHSQGRAERRRRSGRGCGIWKRGHRECTCGCAWWCRPRAPTLGAGWLRV